MSLAIDIDTTELNMDHPTAGRRRRHKSPPSIACTSPPCQCLDWTTSIDTENGPSDEEGEKEAKRQRSEPTTPKSTSSQITI